MKSWFEKARVQFWYWHIDKLKGDRSIYGLNVEFAYKEPLPRSERANQRKIFEGMRDHGRIPRGGDKNLRTLDEIILAVDGHSTFVGTAAVFYSKLWELLALKSISEAEIIQRIDDVFVEFGVERYAMPPKEESWCTGRNPAFDVENPINPIEEMRLQKAKLDQATWQYLRLLQYLSSRTTILRDSNVLFEIFSHSLVNLFERQNEDLGREYKPYLLKWIQELAVIRIYSLNLH